MLELYEQNRVPPSQVSEVDGSGGGGSANRASKLSGMNEEQSSRQVLSRVAPDSGASDGHGTQPRPHNGQSLDRHGAHDGNNVITNHKIDAEGKDRYKPEDQERNGKRNDATEEGEWPGNTSRKLVNGVVGRNLELQEGSVGQSPKEAIKIDKDKVKAALEKRRRERAEMTKKNDVMDDDDLIERELEDGVELAVDDEKIKRERRLSWPKSDDIEERGDVRRQVGVKGQMLRRVEGEINAEEGEMLGDSSPVQNSRKRKGSPVDRNMEGKKRQEHSGGSDNREKEHRRHAQDNGYSAEREHRRHTLENRS